MSEKTDGIRGLNIGGRAFRAVAPVAAFALLTGCSQIPDAVNPVEWYNNTVEFFSGEDEEKKPAGQKQEAAKPSGVGKAPSAADKPFPKLSSVDQQADYYAARKQGLVADTEGRKYAPAIARQGEPTSRLAATPPPAPSAVASAAPAQPAPPAQPAQPVTRAPAGTPTQVASLPTTAEQQAFQARLQSRLNEIRSRAGQPPAALPQATQAVASMAPDNFGTIVVSSQGVDSGITAGAPNPAPVTSGKLAAGGASLLARPARPMAAGAVKVATIHFNNGSASLSARDRQIIANALQLKKERGGKIRIIGHSSSRTRAMDPVRHKMVNLQVSADRADAIARELLRLGLKKEELVVDAVSDAAPLFHEFMPTGEAGNRRAEIYLES